MLNVSVVDTEPSHQSANDAYGRRRASGKTNSDHDYVRQRPNHYNFREGIDAVEEALATRGLPCEHIVAHHDEALRREEQK